MQIRNKKILLKIIKTEDNGIIRPNDVEGYEVYKLSSEVKGLKLGDKVFYENGRKVEIKGVEYILTDDENVNIIL
jgi:hypothetical protein